jgi:hypothetical protein
MPFSPVCSGCGKDIDDMNSVQVCEDCASKLDESAPSASYIGVFMLSDIEIIDVLVRSHSNGRVEISSAWERIKNERVETERIKKELVEASTPFIAECLAHRCAK